MRGFTLTETLVGIGLFALVVTGAISLVQLFIGSAKMTKSHRAVANYRNILIENLNSYSGWRATVVSPNPENTAALGCLRFNTDIRDCTGSSAINQDRLISVVNGDNDTLFDATDPANGFRYDGRNCVGFVRPPAPGNADCPLRFDTTVRIICPLPLTPDTCSNPEIYLQAKLIHNGGPNGPSINPARFAFGFVRALDKNTVRRACDAAGGLYSRNPATGDEMCAMPFAGTCPSGFYVAGLQIDPGRLNQKVCRPVVGRCPAGQLMTGISPNGTPICSSGICSVAAAPPITLPPDPGPVTDPVIFSDGAVIGDGCGGDGGGGCQ